MSRPWWIAGLAGERIAAAAERAGQPAVRRPDRRRRGRERLAPLDVAPHVAQTALETLQQIAQHAERVFRRGERRRRDLRDRRRCGSQVPPAARAFTTAGSFCIARACAGSSVRARAEVVDDALERLNLRRQLAGRRAVAAVLDLERRVGDLQLVDLAASRSTWRRGP